MKKKRTNPARRTPKGAGDFERRFSAGGVVFRKLSRRSLGVGGKNKKFEILLLKRIKRDGSFEWILPKGEIEEKNKEETALREISEETGLSNLKLVGEVGQEQYFYRESWAKGQLIFKKVTYYLVESKGKEEALPQKEEGFIEAKWFTEGEACDKITYKESKKILEKAISAIRTKELKN